MSSAKSAFIAPASAAAAAAASTTSFSAALFSTVPAAVATADELLPALVQVDSDSSSPCTSSSSSIASQPESLVASSSSSLLPLSPPSTTTETAVSIQNLDLLNTDLVTAVPEETAHGVVEKKSLRDTLGVDGPPPLKGYRTERPLILGHRGAPYDYLECTREAFLRAKELGCDGIELDVFVVKDGSLVVFHGGDSAEFPGDMTLHCHDRKDQTIIDLTMEEIRELRFIPEHKEFACPKEIIERGQVPLLSEVLEDLRDDPAALPNGKKPFQIRIELKGPGTVKPTVELAEAMDMLDQVCFSSFQHEKLRELRDFRPDASRYRTGALFFGDLVSDHLEKARDCGATEIHIRYDDCNRETIQRIHNAGFGTLAWLRGPIFMTADTQERFLDVGNEDERCYQALFDSGVQQICLNKPHIAVPMLQQYESPAITSSPSVPEEETIPSVTEQEKAISIVAAVINMLQDQTELNAAATSLTGSSMVQQSASSLTDSRQPQGARVSAY
eukprot:CAMPEP_0172453462 /NCGR_PEP_ID=MMETSP1065-20121228/10772_1 /TAXON_ID=265537 /ORGANISM="Amphiprora paludosa, Strain CCMP125" /LENGTH=501 /DNA_ID=CAMNT_0013205645 /DNA_START=14 /DNA_END=1519 /DNA_ORIENTATION=+